MSKACRALHLYPFPDFYSQAHYDDSFDTRLTAWQQENIQSIFSFQDRLFRKRKEKAEMISKIIPPVSSIGTFPVYACFVKDIPMVEKMLGLSLFTVGNA